MTGENASRFVKWERWWSGFYATLHKVHLFSGCFRGTTRTLIRNFMLDDSRSNQIKISRLPWQSLVKVFFVKLIVDDCVVERMFAIDSRLLALKKFIEVYFPVCARCFQLKFKFPAENLWKLKSFQLERTKTETSFFFLCWFSLSIYIRVVSRSSV